MTTSTTLNTSERFAARSFLQAIIDAGGVVDTNGLDLNASAVAETARLAGGETVRIMRGTASRAAVLNALVDAGAITITVGDRDIPRRIEAHTDNVADVDATIPPATERKTRPMVLTKHRRAIITTLANHGPFFDESGQATAALMTAVGYQGDDTASFGLLLRYLASEGMIERDTRGRRTFRIDLTPAGRTLATTLGCTPLLDRCAAAIARNVHRHGEATRAYVWAKVSGRDRAALEREAVIARAIELGYVTPVPDTDWLRPGDVEPPAQTMGRRPNGPDGEPATLAKQVDATLTESIAEVAAELPRYPATVVMVDDDDDEPTQVDVGMIGAPLPGTLVDPVDGFTCTRDDAVPVDTSPFVAERAPTIPVAPGITAHDIAIELLNAAADIINHPPTAATSDDLDALKARHAAEIDELVTRLAKQVEYSTAQANDLRKVRAELADAGDTIRALRSERDGLRARAQRVEAQLDKIVRNDARIATEAYTDGVNDAINSVMKAKPTNH